MRKRVLIITEAGSAWTSGLLRAFIYKDLFATHNIHVDYISRRSNLLTSLGSRQGLTYNRFLDAGLADIIVGLNVVIARRREEMIIQQARKGYDAIYLQKVVSLDLFARLKKLSNARLVFDLNDGLWLPSHSGTSNQHILEILKMADSITCDNLYGIAFAKNYNSNTFLVPDPSQVEIFDRYRNTFEKPEARYILGWVGSPSTLFNIFVIWEALEKVFSRNKNILLRLIGTGYNRSLLPRFEQVIYENVPYYTNADMIQHILGMNIGLFPMFDVEDSQIRGILKASVYMSGEAAVIASPRGQITDLIKHGINGFTANNTDEWIKYMELLIRDHALRKSITTAGLETVRLHFSLEKSFNSLLHALGLQHH